MGAEYKGEERESSAFLRFAFIFPIPDDKAPLVPMTRVFARQAVAKCRFAGIFKRHNFVSILFARKSLRVSVSGIRVSGKEFHSVRR